MRQSTTRPTHQPRRSVARAGGPTKPPTPALRNLSDTEPATRTKGSAGTGGRRHARASSVAGGKREGDLTWLEEQRSLRGTGSLESPPLPAVG